MRDDLVHARMGIQRACMRGETRCMRACGDLACAYAHGGLAWAWGSSVHGQRISAVHACAWRPGACTHGDPACVRGDPVCARMGILRACVRAWGPGACTHGGPACVRGDPVCARMGILCACVRAWGPGACTHGHPACVRACVRAWGPSACTHGDRACVDLVHACAGSSMHSGDSMRACVRTGIRYGCEDPAGTGRRSIPCMKAWEPACNVFAMKKGRQ